VSARLDYANVWRDSWVTFAQVPVAGLLATEYLCQTWVERSKTYFTQVNARLALARPATAMVGDNVMADVISEDLAEAARALVRDLVSLPGQTAERFNSRLEGMINDVLTRIQPDAKTDVRAYVVNELGKLNRELSRLREVTGAEIARLALGAPAGRRPRNDRRDAAALRRLRADLKAIANGRAPGQRSSGRRTVPRERMLVVLQAVFDAALARFLPETQRVPRVRREDRTARRLLQLQNAQIRIEEAKGELAGTARPLSRAIGQRRRRGR
jgi:hypothetical protein